MLAKQANMSERFVAQIELGIGNPSVLSLDAIARALTLDVFDLLPAVTPEEARRRALVHLRQLPVEEIKSFLNAFAQHGVAMPTARDRALRWSACAAPEIDARRYAGEAARVLLSSRSTRSSSVSTARPFQRCSRSTDRRHSAATNATA
jgi:transcriptional regulator with XRE-family HTH domain